LLNSCTSLVLISAAVTTISPSPLTTTPPLLHSATACAARSGSSYVSSCHSWLLKISCTSPIRLSGEATIVFIAGYVFVVLNCMFRSVGPSVETLVDDGLLGSPVQANVLCAGDDGCGDGDAFLD